MISFLLIIDKQGFIHEIKWSHPVFIVSSHDKSIFDLIAIDYHESVKETIVECCGKKDEVQCSKILLLNDMNSLIDVFILAINSEMLLFAAEKIYVEDSIEFANLKFVISNFMKTIRELSVVNIFSTQESTKYQFENIQSFNNDLINTRRMLEKANAQMKILNADLNNRLVKDSLTGLVSRYQYRTEMEYAIVKNPDKLGVFIFIDIDNFKSVNDNYGHASGDAFLVEFARRLQSLPIENSIKLRIAGDEFGLFAYGLEEANDLVLSKIWDLIKFHIINPIRIGDNELQLSISAGMSVYGIDTNEIYELIEYADLAMYIAKKEGKNNYRVYGKS